MTGYAEGVHLLRTEERRAEIDALADLLGGRVDLEVLLRDLNRRARRSWAPGRAAREAITWDRQDRRTTRWWPQGISTSADATEDGEVHGRRVVATSWYAKELPDGHHGARVSLIDLDTRRYRHVLLVVADRDPGGRLVLRPLRIHAGGLVWCGRYLHLAATARGLVTCSLDDLMRVPDSVAGNPARLGVDGDRVASLGYRYLLPVRFGYEAVTDDGHERLRYSFLSLDRQTSPPQVLAGEYARGNQSRRLVRYPVDPATGLLDTGEDGTSRPLGLDESGVAQAQGAVAAAGRTYLTVSHGPWTPGSVYAGRPGTLVRHRWAVPMGPEDVAAWPERDELWSLTEHPRRRWVFSMPRTWFDR